MTQGAHQLTAAREAASTAEVRATELGLKLLELQIQLEEADVRTAQSQVGSQGASMFVRPYHSLVNVQLAGHYKQNHMRALVPYMFV